MARALLVLVVALLLTACSRGLSGTYTDEVGFMSFTFERDGRVVQSTLGLEVEMRYQRDGDRIVIENGMGDFVFTRIDADTLEGPLGMRLRRQE